MYDAIMVGARCAGSPMAMLLTTLLMKEGKKPGTFLLPHGMIFLEFKGFGMFMEDDPSGVHY
jgi:hypothetical protein